MSEQPANVDEERIRLTQELWSALGLYDRDLPSTTKTYSTSVSLTDMPFRHGSTGARHVLDAQRGNILYSHHGHLYRVTLTVTAED